MVSAASRWRSLTLMLDCYHFLYPFRLHPSSLCKCMNQMGWSQELHGKYLIIEAKTTCITSD